MRVDVLVVALENTNRGAQILYDLLVSLDSFYTPSMSSRIDLKEYALKLLKNGTVFCSLDESGKYVGLVAFYANDVVRRRAFISTIGVLPEYHGTGVASVLLLKAIDVSIKNEMDVISLEVDARNKRAIGFYKKHGFYEERRVDEATFMAKHLVDAQPHKIPLVSVCCVTYNHASFIDKTMDGFLKQRTSFPIEILIHDDASNDGTVEVLREYEKKHPDRIFPIYQKENQYSKGIKISSTYQFPRARGKYIALCEGDDYWTDPLKLQTQVDFLEQNPDYSACFTDVAVLNELDRNEYATYAASSLKSGDVDMEEIIQVGGSIFPTASLVFRSSVLDQKIFPGLLEDLAGDTALIIAAAMQGKVFYMDRKTAVYRIWKGGMYSGISADPQLVSDWKLKRIVGYKKLQRIIDKKWRRAVRDKISSESLYVILHSKRMDRYRCLVDLTASGMISLMKGYAKSFIRIWSPDFKRSPRQEG